ncbi:HD-GYP domain, c-di-GMP phosphodiesterase class II (or its inactivated variant) [Peptoclostridium litorale DSM 5388]|uniref:HD-GYP domain-containing protein n=1 Tax=Peptoclostridium litorale DSM 5388 TaxID=1121324 RepID=A0A069RHA9_PEPLI|nr:HD-GYP domain-containing protein [Peptoclostridium litorale]KDR96434.1 hypothetical protein CLIT_2c00400 [Peptoclostridium litorale DSM 5388]SIN70634.1 HD-GYP domain, c-di-GMP phosphodiesterase class II (or its inactivated variant) [Peptoclostridium litorale DSM 5388]
MDIWFYIAISLAMALVAALIKIKRNNGKIATLIKLNETSKKITSSIKLKDLMGEIMEIAKTETNAETGSIYIVDEEKQELWFEVAFGEKGVKLKETRLEMGEGIAGWVAKEGKSINSRDADNDTSFKKEISEKIKLKQKSMLTIPIKFKEKTLGVLQVINKKGKASFDDKDEAFLEAISTSAAIAIENAKLYKEMKNTYFETIHALASSIDAKDPYTRGHSHRVTEYSVEIGKEMNLRDDELERLEYMAVLHDIGKIGIRDSILNKTAPLNDEEYEVIKDHPLIGAKILESSKSLKMLINGVKYHHEKYDGTGYGEGLKGREIPLGARIIAVADAYDAMTTDRPYRKGLSHEISMEEINKFSGRQFDPEIVRHFNAMMERKLVDSHVG